MNTITKGRRNEIKTHKLLENQGYIVHTTRRSSHRGGDNDIFNCFDHVAVKIINPNMQMFNIPAFIQTRSNQKGDLRKIKEFVSKTKMSVYVIVWFDRVPKPKVYKCKWDWKEQKFVCEVTDKFIQGEIEC